MDETQRQALEQMLKAPAHRLAEAQKELRAAFKCHGCHGSGKGDDYCKRCGGVGAWVEC